MSGDKLTVTQADRDVAADLWRDFVARPGECIVENCLRRAEMDDSGLIHSIARHRTNTTTELVEALRDFCISAECAAGCVEDVTEDDAYSEILSFAGSALGVSYLNARKALALHDRGEVE